MTNAIRPLNLQDHAQCQQLLAVQLPAYRIEAELIGFDGIPPLHDTTDTLQACDEIFYGYYMKEELVGAISYLLEPDPHTGEETLDICRLVVHPDHFRRGIAAKLLRHLFTLHSRIARFTVSTGAKNTPAKTLYRRFGFQETGTLQVAPGVELTQFAKKVRV